MVAWANSATVLITGAASGLGAACAEHFLKLGFHVALADIQNHDHLPIAEKRAQFFKIDVTETATLMPVFTALEQSAWPPLRVLINCAGIAPGERVLGREQPMPLDHFKKVVDINLVGTFDMIRLAAAHMAQLAPISQTSTRGVILNTASIAAFEGQMGQAAYSASKGAIVAMTLPLAREFAAHGIRVVTLAPGLMDTPMLANMPDKVQAQLQSQWQFPQRCGYPEEFALLAQQVCENEYLNGCTLRLDGAVRL